MHVLGDNFHVDVKSSSYDHFELAMSLAMNGHTASHYAETNTWGLLLFWWIDKDEAKETVHFHSVYQDENLQEWEEEYQIVSLEKKQGVIELLEWTWSWLDSQEYPSEPDHDGLNEKGYHISTGNIWGYHGTHLSTICSIKPYWIMLGK